MINQLAQEAKTEETSFTSLYNLVESQFKSIADKYLIRNNLTGFNFEVADYISAIGQAMWEAIKDYDSTKGDFMPRAVAFANKRMKDTTDYNLASKRYDKSKQVISFDLLFEAEEFDLEDKDAQINETAKLVSEFVANDKDGMVIRILTSTSDTKLRKSAFIQYFGKYEATERKRVQRVRERLQAHLKTSGVFI